MLRPYTPLPQTVAALACSLQLCAPPAAAHIDLQAPLSRYSNVRSGANEACPCGSGTTSRRCNDPASFSDGNRSLDRVTTYAPGETITVRFSEYVGHSGRYRIAFDPDGAELSDFNQLVLLDEPDPAGAAGNIGEGTTWELQVTLPDVTCDNCTLQLIQVIDGNTTEPVLDPASRGETYFQCADLVLAEGTPPAGVPPLNPGAHLAQLSRPGRTPASAAPDGPLPAGQGAAPGMLAGATAGEGNASSEPEPMAGGAMSSPSGREGACSLAPSPAPRVALTGPTVLGMCLALLLRRGTSLRCPRTRERACCARA